MAAHSFVRLGAQLFFSYRESYAPEFAAMFRDDELVTTLAAPFYALTTQQLRERLDLLGFTSATARRRLDTYYEEALQHDPDLESFSDWLARNAEAIANDDAMAEEVPGRVAYGDPRLALRLMLDAAPADTQVGLDLSEVVSRGYMQGTPDLCARAFQEQHGEAAYAPLIVLTEGKTDAEFRLRNVMP
jgi:hypothetical protein